MYEIRERVGASRTDTNGVMRLASAFDILQDCSLLWLESEPSFRDFLHENNLGMFLVSRQADILRLPVYGESVAVQTSVYECRSFFGYRNTVLYGADGLPCILTWSIGAFVDRTTGKMARLPPDELEKITLDEKVHMAYLDKKITLPELPSRRLGALPVRRADIDFYHHMNNARYIERALEFLPEGLSVHRLRIEFKAPAKPGSLLYPHIIASPDGNWYVLLTDEQDKPYTVMEFS